MSWLKVLLEYGDEFVQIEGPFQLRSQVVDLVDVFLLAEARQLPDEERDDVVDRRLVDEGVERLFGQQLVAGGVAGSDLLQLGELHKGFLSDLFPAPSRGPASHVARIVLNRRGISECRVRVRGVLGKSHFWVYGGYKLFLSAEEMIGSEADGFDGLS